MVLSDWNQAGTAIVQLGDQSAWRQRARHAAIDKTSSASVCRRFAISSVGTCKPTWDRTWFRGARIQSACTLSGLSLNFPNLQPSVYLGSTSHPSDIATLEYPWISVDYLMGCSLLPSSLNFTNPFEIGRLIAISYCLDLANFLIRIAKNLSVTTDKTKPNLKNLSLAYQKFVSRTHLALPAIFNRLFLTLGGGNAGTFSRNRKHCFRNLMLSSRGI